MDLNLDQRRMTRLSSFPGRGGPERIGRVAHVERTRPPGRHCRRARRRGGCCSFIERPAVSLLGHRARSRGCCPSRWAEYSSCAGRCGQERSAWRPPTGLSPRVELKYRELVELANSIILRWTRDGRIIFLNEFGLRFFGYTAGEIIGRRVVDTIVPATNAEGSDLAKLMDRITADPTSFSPSPWRKMTVIASRRSTVGSWR